MGNTNIRVGSITQLIAFFMMLWLFGCAESTAIWLGHLARAFWLAATGAIA